MTTTRVVVALALVLLLGGCARHPVSGYWVPLWQARADFKPYPVEMPLICETRERGERLITTCF